MLLLYLLLLFTTIITTVFDSDFQNLLSRCLHPNFRDRITAEEILRHPWLQSEEEEESLDASELRLEEVAEVGEEKLNVAAVGHAQTLDDADSSKVPHNTTLLYILLPFLLIFFFCSYL